MAAKKALLPILALLLVSCGFHMRGKLQLPAAMKTIYFQNASMELVGEVAVLLRFSNATLTPLRQNAGVIVNVTNEQFRRVSLSISTKGKTNEYELYYSVDYEMLDAAGKILSPKKNIVITRSFYLDQTQILAMGSEEGILRQDIYKQAARTIVERGRFALSNAEN
jgi:LPS-assembly lipoprotein